MAGKEVRLRWATTCADCEVGLAAGDPAWWDSAAKTATCSGCRQSAPASVQSDPPLLSPAPPSKGGAGRSARREYERRADRERSRKEASIARDVAWRAQVKEARPILGRIASVMTPKPVMTPESQSTTAWAVGAVGEELLGAAIDSWPGIVALHDRRIPGSKANIDHIIVGPAGIFVIDAKRYSGEVHRRDVGSFFRPDNRLYVGRRDCTKLVAGVLHQAQEARKALGSDGADIPIFGGLCFVEATWGLFTRPFAIDGVWVGWPKALRKHLSQSGPMTVEAVETTARRLATALKAA